ncbi:MAG: bifunctional phosphoglucose/phosphomannose isomerase [Candidatus Thorarchaeota archaeon]
MTLPKNIDLSSMRGMVSSFPDLLNVTTLNADARNFALQTSNEKTDGICLIGMGGSSIAGEMIRCILSRTANIPIISVRGYDIPVAVNKDWTVITISYSGNTEETLSAFDTVINRGCKVCAITTGGELASRSKTVPVQVIPAGLQPRAALPLIFSVVLLMLQTILDDEPIDLNLLSEDVRDQSKEWSQSLLKPVALAEKLKQTTPVFVASEHLVPVAYRAKCQMNENGKIPAFYSEIPESNHNEIEAIDSFRERSLLPIFIRSSFESQRIEQRFDATQIIYGEQGCTPITVRLKAKTILEEVLALTHYLDMVSVELADIRGVDSASVPRISRLKSILSSKR